MTAPSWQHIKNCRTNGTNKHHSGFASYGTWYETCYDWKGSDGSKGSGNAVPKNSHGICEYPPNAIEAFCVPTNPPASNTTCPDGFESKNGKCHGAAHGGFTHDFTGYTDTQKAQWVCNAGKGVTWYAVLPNKPRGQTWWIGDENSGYCTNNKVDIITQGMCGSFYGYGNVLHSDKDSNRWICAPPTVDANKHFLKHYKPNTGPFFMVTGRWTGNDEVLYAQIMQNLKFHMNHCWQEGRVGKCKKQNGSSVNCKLAEMRCRYLHETGEDSWFDASSQDNINISTNTDFKSFHKEASEKFEKGLNNEFEVVVRWW